MFLRLYPAVCLVVLLLCAGGCATQSVLNSKMGQSEGTEGIFPLDVIDQPSSNSLVLRGVYLHKGVGYTVKPEVCLFETVVHASGLASFIKTAPRQASDGLPIVDGLSVFALGTTRWLGAAPPDVAGRFTSDIWWETCNELNHTDDWFFSNKVAFIRSVDFDHQPTSIVFRGQSYNYEEWAWWTTPVQTVLLVPAVAWDALTAILQIPYFLIVDAVHSTLSLGDPGHGNPWRRGFSKPDRRVRPRLADPQGRRVLLTPETYDDLRFEKAGWQEKPEAIRQYLAQFPDGRHVREATNKLARFAEMAEEQRLQNVWSQASDSDQLIAGLKLYLKQNPSSKFAKAAREQLDLETRRVTVYHPQAQTNLRQGAPQAIQIDTFIIGRTTRADIESLLGPGVPEVSAQTHGAAALRWYFSAAATSARSRPFRARGRMRRTIARSAPHPRDPRPRSACACSAGAR